MSIKLADIQSIFRELKDAQRQKLHAFAAELYPNITADDLLQPNDYPELEMHPYFRYLEGILQGVQGSEMALTARCKEEIYV